MPVRKLNIDAIYNDPNKMPKKADYQVKIRDFITNYGKDYGIKADDIGWYRDKPGSLGIATLGGDDLIKLERAENNRGWASRDELVNAIDNYAKQRGMTRQSEKAVQYAPPSYNPDKYSSKIDEILNSIMNRPQFSYDYRTDPSYQSYKEQFNRQGDRALANTMSEASAMTGGRLNSWAMSAGNQARAQYDQRLNDIIPQLEKLAYARYMGDLDSKQSALETIRGLANDDYRKAMDQRDFNYRSSRDILGDKRYESELDYARERDALKDKRYDEEFLYKKALQDRDFALRSKQASDSNARAWANYNLNKKEFDYRKTKDERQKLTQKEKEEMLGAVYSEMMSSDDPGAWLIKEAPYMPDEVLKAAEKWVPKENSDFDKWLMERLAK